MSSERDLRHNRVSLYSDCLVFGDNLQPDILKAIGKTSRSNLDIGAISIVGAGPEDLTPKGVKKIKNALCKADTIADSFCTGSPGLWIFNPDDPNIGRAREIAHNCNGLFTYNDNKLTREFTAAYKILSIIHAIDLADMIGQGRFVTFHVGDFTCEERADDIRANLYMVGEYARAKGVTLGLERGEVLSKAMVDYVKELNIGLGHPIVWVNDDTANAYIWGSGEDPLEGSRVLAKAGVVRGKHIKGAVPISGADKAAWQANEAGIYEPTNIVDVIEQLKISKELVGPDGKPLRATLESELFKGGATPADNYRHVKRSIEHMVKCMIQAGY